MATKTKNSDTVEVMSMISNEPEFTAKDMMFYGRLDCLWHLQLKPMIASSPVAPTSQGACEEAVKQLVRRLIHRNRRSARYASMSKMIAATVVNCTTISRVWHRMAEEVNVSLPSSFDDQLKHRFSFVVFTALCGEWALGTPFSGASSASKITPSILKGAELFLQGYIDFTLLMWKHSYGMSEHGRFGTKFRVSCQMTSKLRRKALSAVHRGYSGKCAACGATAVDLPTSLKSCSACNAVYYCGRECQRAHWKQHKGACVEMKKEKDKKKKKEPPWHVRVDHNKQTT